MENDEKNNLLRRAPLVLASAAVVGLLACGLWVMLDPAWAARLELRQPGLDDAEASGSRGSVRGGPAAGAKEWGKLETFAGQPMAGVSAAWPHFRGADRTNIVQGGPALAQSWPAAGPRVLWSVELGEGHAGPAVRDGCVYLLDYDRNAKADVLRCLSLADGKDLWRYSYPVMVHRNHGMSRTVPALAGPYVVSLGPKCHVLCLDARSGRFVWGLDLVAEHGTTVPQWYAGQCPLIDGERLILAPGGPKALLMALNLADGKVLWKTPNPRDWKMTHTSVVPVELEGTKMYLYAASHGVVGVSADDGRLLWEFDQWKISIANVPTPVHVDGGRFFLTGGYNAGGMMIQVAREGGSWKASRLFTVEAREFCSEQQTPILYRGRLLSVLSKGGPISQQLACMDLTGKVVWTSGAEHQYGLGPFLVANDLIYALKDTGELTLGRLSDDGMTVLARANVLYRPSPQGTVPATDAWGPMVLVEGRLLLRDLTRMLCLDVSAPR